MAEPTTARPGIDPIMAALLEAFPFKFTADDGVEVAREQMRQLKAPPEALPDMRIEERTIAYGDITGIPVRIYWPPIAQHDNLPVVVFYHGGGWSIGDLDTPDPVARAIGMTNRMRRQCRNIRTASDTCSHNCHRPRISV